MNLKYIFSAASVGFGLLMSATPAFSQAAHDHDFVHIIHSTSSVHTHPVHGLWDPFVCLQSENAIASSVIAHDGAKIVDAANVTAPGLAEAGLFFEPGLSSDPTTLSFILKAPAFNVGNSPTCTITSSAGTSVFNVAAFGTQTSLPGGYILVNVDLTQPILGLTEPANAVALFITEVNNETALFGSVVYNRVPFGPDLHIHGGTVNECFARFGEQGPAQ
jgi:hypothetical protein